MDDSSSSIRLVRFGPFQVDLRAGELRKHDIRIRLQEKPFQILVLLLQRPGEVVTREELRQRLWPADVFVDFDHSLNTAINKIREALSDSSETPRYVETLARRGYRFIAAVERQDAAPSVVTRIMLAVLPFENLSKDPEQDYFSDGMTEEMIAQLGRLYPQRLGVIARTSAMHYKHTDKRVDQIGRELGVQFVLEGSVRRANGRVRISAQLIRVSDQTHLWAETYDRKLEDVLAIQSDVAEHIARSLTVELLPERRDLMARASTRNSEAYELYLLGRYHLNKRTAEGFARAVGHLQQAIEKDPAYALAYAGLADAYNISGLYGIFPRQEIYARSKQLAMKALEIDERLAEAHTALAFVLMQYDWDWPAAEREHCRAIELNPNYASGHAWFGIALMEAGRFAEARAELERAKQLDPLSLVINSHLGWLLYFAGDYEGSERQLKRTLELDTDFTLARYFLGMTYIQMGAHDGAIAELRRAVELSGNHPGGLSGLVYAYSLAGKREEARRVLQEMKDMEQSRYVPPYFMALALTGLGELDAAIECLEQAYPERSGWMIHLKIKIEPAFGPLRAHPRYAILMERLERMQAGASVPAR